MPYTRDDLRTMRKERMVLQFSTSVEREILSAANQGKTHLYFPEPHYERSAWGEFLKDILDRLQAEFPGCDIELDEHLGITIRWD